MKRREEFLQFFSYFFGRSADKICSWIIKSWYTILFRLKFSGGHILLFSKRCLDLYVCESTIDIFMYSPYIIDSESIRIVYIPVHRVSSEYFHMLFKLSETFLLNLLWLRKKIGMKNILHHLSDEILFSLLFEVGVEFLRRRLDSIMHVRSFRNIQSRWYVWNSRYFFEDRMIVSFW